MDPHFQLPSINQLSRYGPANNRDVYSDSQNPPSRRTSSRPAAIVFRSGPTEEEMDQFDDQRLQFSDSWREAVDNSDPDYAPPGRYARRNNNRECGRMLHSAIGASSPGSPAYFNAPLSPTVSSDPTPPTLIPANPSLEGGRRSTLASAQLALDSFALRASGRQPVQFGHTGQFPRDLQRPSESLVEGGSPSISTLGAGSRRRRHSQLSAPATEPDGPLGTSTENMSASAPKRPRLPEDDSLNGVPLSLHSAFALGGPAASTTDAYSTTSSPADFVSNPLPASTPGTPRISDTTTSESAPALGWSLHKPPGKKPPSRASLSLSKSRTTQSSQAPERPTRKENRVGPTDANLAFYSKLEQPLIQHMKKLLLGHLYASNPWANPQTREKLIKDAFNGGMQSGFAGECPDFTLSDGLMQLMIDHISTGRSRVKSAAAKAVETHLGLKTGDELDENDTIGQEELYATNRLIVQTALDANNFVYREYNNRSDRGGVFRSPMIRRVLLAFFTGEHSEGALSWPLYEKGIPVVTVAFICTALQCTISEWITGKKSPREFSRTNYNLIYDGFVEGFELHAKERPEYAKETLQMLARSAGIRAKKISGTDSDAEPGDDSMSPQPFVSFFSSTDRD